MKTYRLQCTENFREELIQILNQCHGEETKIVFSAGTYLFREGVVLNEEHQHISFVAEGEVHLRGAVPLRGWRKPEAEEVLYMTEDAREQVLVCDLDKAGCPSCSDFVSRGFGRNMVPGHSELFCDGEPLCLAQYPKGDEFAKITGVDHSMEMAPGMFVGSLEKGFYCDDERLKSWHKNEDAWILGYWCFDWAPTCEKMESYDPQTGKIMVKEPYGWEKYCIGQRIRFYNIPEEVTQPGDYYIDRKNRKAWLYPKEAGKEIWISVLTKPFFLMESCKDISFHGFTFEMTCGVALEANFCEGLCIENCTLKNIGSAAINVLEGHDIEVANNTIHDCGDSGIIVCGGNRCTLEPMRASVDNNHIYRIGKWTKCYQVAVYFHGVGMKASHNLIHDLPHTAIMFWGNEIHLTDNEIYRALLESGDAGAVYTGRDYTYRGNRVCHNYIHHIGNSCDLTNGIYNDDCVSGTVMRDNYLEEVQNGLLLGGGRDYLVENNVFVNCDNAIYYDDRAVHRSQQWRGMMDEILKPRFYHIMHYPYGDIKTDRFLEESEKCRGEYASATDAVYMEKYPELKEIDRMFKERTYCERIGIPGSLTVRENVFLPRSVFKADKKELSFDNIIRFWNRGGAWNLGNELTLERNYVGKPEDLRDAEWGDLTVRPDSDAMLSGFFDHGLDTIGLQEWKRTQNPAFVKTRVFYEPESRMLKIGLRNQKESRVSGSLLFDIKGMIELMTDKIDFELGGKEEQWFSVEVLSGEKNAKLEIYSLVPGVRPSRLQQGVLG